MIRTKIEKSAPYDPLAEWQKTFTKFLPGADQKSYFEKEKEYERKSLHEKGTR